MDDVEKIKQKIDVVDLISEYIPMKKAGRNFKANCPFHNEKSPSFVASPERQMWHCFGCGKGGDIFTFVGEYERLDFSESLKVLAEKAGIKLTTNAFKTKTEEKRAKMYAINHLTAQFYNYLLTKHPTGKKALSYVTEERKISPALIETFLLGYAPSNSHSLSQYLTSKKGFTPDDLLEAGVSFYKNGRLMDFFQNRLMFPISDSRNNIIAFSGRALNNTVMPKYINTKETPVYIKGDSLYGIQFAKDAIKKEGKVILMEGEFDVLSSVKEGISNVVAVKGTALTENQIKLLKRFTSKIVFCFDTDAAGIEAQKRSITLIGKEEMNAAVVIPPEGKDADEILNENPLLFKKALKNEVNIYDFIIDSALKEENATTAEGKKNILQKTLSFLVEIDNEIIKEHYIKKLATSLDTSMESIMRELNKLSSRTPQRPNEPEVVKQKLTREEMIEQHLLTLILQSPNPKDATVLTSSILSSVPLTLSSLDRLFSLLKEYFTTNSELNLQEFTKLLPQELHSVFDLCFLTPLPPFTSDEGYAHSIQKTAQEVKILAVKKHLQEISERIKEEEKRNSSEEIIEKLQNEFDSLSSHLKS